MYMVAHASTLTDEAEDTGRLSGWSGFTVMREAFAIGQQQSMLEIQDCHQKVLRELLVSAKPSDVVIYDFALDTLKLCFRKANPDLVEQMKTAIARMMVSVGKAAGEGFFGGGHKVTAAQKACIQTVVDELRLLGSPTAAQIFHEAELKV
jgi:hypothetical protein